MAIVIKDRVKEAAPAPGTGTITLGGAASGFQAFSSIGNGNVTYFAIVDSASGAWEVNYGTYTSSGTTLTRNATPLSSSNAGALVNFTGAVDVFCTYPAEKAIYEETSGNVLIDGGPITVIGDSVTTYTTFSAALGEMYANIVGFAQFYAQNLNDDVTASTDIVAYNDLGDGATNFIDMGINSSTYSDPTYEIFTAGSGYVYNDGGELIIGSATDDVLLFAGGLASTDWAARIDKTTKALTTKTGVNVGGALAVTGAATFSSTVALSANPTTALQAATKQYVDNQVTAGIHIHEPVLVTTTGNLTATYTGGGTNSNIILIASGTDITFFGATPAVGDQFYIGSSSNGLLANTAYFVVNVITAGTIQASLTFGGAIVTGLTNGAPTIPSIINSGVGATLTNAGAQAALSIDSIPLSTTNRVLVRLQTAAAENGVYTVTTVGDGSTNWVLTRSTDANMVNPASPDGLGTGDYFFVQSGTTGAGDSYTLNTAPNTMIIGYTDLTYTQFSGAITYTGGTNIDVTGQVISVTGAIGAANGGTGQATVTTGDLLYGSGTNTWGKLAVGASYKSLVVNGAGTQVEWNAVALNQSGAVSGALPATNGGTGLIAYTLGDIVYSSAANTLAALAGNTTTTKKFLVQTGTGAISAVPAWGTVDGADVSGNISGSAGSVANALTLGTYLTGTSFNGSSAVTATVDATSANTASKVVARDISGNFAAGTITAALSGNATTATAATNVAGGTNNKLVYQASANTTAFADAPSASGQVLGWNGSAFTWATSIATATTATNLAGGSAGTVPYQSASGTTAMLAAGASGQVLTSSGAGAPTWTTASSGGFSNIAVLTSGTSWTAPAGVTKIKVIVTGGGGGGGGTSSSLGRAGGGGAAGATAIKIFTVVPATSYTYAIGAAGTAGISGGGAGGAGGNSTFTVGATTVTGGGGGGGTGGNSGSISGGTGGTATNGDMNIKGGGGGGGAPGAGYEQTPSGMGGSSYWGGGAPGGANTTGTFGGVTATTYGTGGSGASSNNTSGAGGAGFQGVILIEY